MKWSLPATCALLLSAVPLSAQISLGDPLCGSGQPGIPSADAVIARWVDVPYTGPSVRTHCNQHYNVFVPDGPQPPGGWPVMVYLDLSGFKRSARRWYIDPISSADDRARLAVLALRNQSTPMVVIYASATVSRGGATGNQIFDVVYDPWNVPNAQYGEDYEGNGVFIPPGEIPPSYSGVGEPYLDPDRPMPEKDAVMLVQHVKYHADSFPPGASSPIQLDTSKMVVTGTSAAAVAWNWVVLGPDRAAETFPNPAPGSQEVLNTRVPAAVLDGGVAWFQRFKQDSEINGAALGLHLPARTNTPGPAFYDKPARHLNQVVDVAYQDAASPLAYGWDGPAGPTTNLNRQLALYMAYLEPTTAPLPLCFDVDPDTGAPGACLFDVDVELTVHPSWSGHAWKLLYPQMRLGTILKAAYTVGGNQVFVQGQPNAVPDLVLGNGATAKEFAFDQMKWIDATFAGQTPRWTDLGKSLAGTLPAPVLRGDGMLLPGSPAQLFLKGGLPDATTALVAGASRVDVPFLGGVLVPSVDVLLWGQTDAEGGAVVGTDFPALPSGTEIYFQQWVQDPGAPYGASASNALEALVP